MFSRIERKETFTVVGTQVTAPCECPSPHIAPIVCEYFKNRAGVKNIVSELEYGVNVMQGDKFTYTFGQEVSKAEDVPEGMVVTEVEAAEYAVFTHKGSVKTLGSAYKFIYATWLPENGYQGIEKPQLEVYGKDFKGANNEESVMDIYIPVKKIEKTEDT